LKLIKLSATASTNSYLKDLGAQIRLEDDTIVWAETQFDGRGQRGNPWTSEAGKSLTFSMFKRFLQLRSEEHIRINLAVSLGIARSLIQLNIPQITIKWPNDIMSYNKKICGILIENQLQGNSITGSVVGIGLNVNNTEFHDLPNAGSLYLATEKTFDLESVLRQVSLSLSSHLDKVENIRFESLIEDYHTMLFRKDTISVFEYPDGSLFNGIILGLSSDGKLLVELEDEKVIEFGMKEISLRY
jgi:BirA family biotin operon repressor/biotin-[acetyl-CoA-carboxylase] ligase